MTVSTQTYNNYINGNWVTSESKETVESINPANVNEVVGLVNLSTEKDVELAVVAAKNAKKSWGQLAGHIRGEYLRRVANILENRLEDIAEAMTEEMGKTLPEAKGETARGIALLRYYAEEGTRGIGEVIPSSDAKALMYTKRVPLGVVGCITPWNFPVAIPIWKVAPALIYGNTVVIKPALETSVTTSKVIECFADAGLPQGVINMVNGKGSVVGQTIAEHQDVNGITFTGSNNVGQQIAAAALKRGAKYQLEMGGKNPVIVTEDADLELAAELTVSGAMKSTGQKCTATSRCIVVESVYDEFRKILINKINQIVVGDGLDPNVYMGPLVNKKQLQTTLDAIQQGKGEGATLVLGGKVPTDEKLNNGFFVEPTLFENVTTNMKIAQEEIFGPVLALIKASNVQEAINIANDVRFGLSASIFTTNIGNALEFIEDIEAGSVRVNGESAGVEYQAPFGGMKQSSSHSREQGQAAKEFFTSIKTIYIKA